MTRFPLPTPPPAPPRPAVFLDRDDTLIENATLPAEAFPTTPGDLYDPAWVRPLPGAVDACRSLARAGYTLVMITNQGCVARGNATLEQVHATNARTSEVFSDPDGNPCSRESTPHPTIPRPPSTPGRGDHACRKPNPG